ncbi:hypothetical protein Ciccas_006144 [Cichlidogyrus casuarinus]|uniref:Uncharacterized protein n=1 Tax=Cichlidogyrus casuarinus TaxID=1844966 RepID=A0ABD2Q6N8_9PLAT
MKNFNAIIVLVSILAMLRSSSGLPTDPYFSQVVGTENEHSRQITIPLLEEAFSLLRNGGDKEKRGKSVVIWRV